MVRGGGRLRGMAVGRYRLTLGCQMLFHGGLVELVRFALLDGDGVHGALTQAGPQAVAEVVGGQHRLAVDDGDGPLGAGGYAVPAAVTFIRVDLYDFSQHVCCLLVIISLN